MTYRRDKISPKGGYVSMRSEAQKRADEKYYSKTAYVFKLNLNRGGHAHIIERLDSVPNKTGYIKNLIREDIHGDTVTQEGAGEV